MLGVIGCLGLLLILGGGLLALQAAGQRTAASPAPSPRPRVTSGAPTPLRDTVLLADDFARPGRSSFEAGEDEETRYRFERGTYRIEVVPADMLGWSLTDGSYSDVVIEVDARLVAGPPNAAVGLIFRYQDEENFYLFNVSGEGFYNLELLHDGNWQTLIDWTAAPAIKPPGTTNRLSVETRGERITLAVNTVELETTVDHTFAAGEAALVVNTFERGEASAIFDNLLIKARN